MQETILRSNNFFLSKPMYTSRKRFTISVPCGPSRYYSNGVCEMCQAGTYQDKIKGECQSCDTGYTANSQQTGCIRKYCQLVLTLTLTLYFVIQLTHNKQDASVSIVNSC